MGCAHKETQNQALIFSQTARGHTRGRRNLCPWSIWKSWWQVGRSFKPMCESSGLPQIILLFALYNHGGFRLCWEKWLCRLLLLPMCKKIYNFFHIRILHQTILVCPLHKTSYSWKTWNQRRFHRGLLVYLFLRPLCTRTNYSRNKEGHHWEIRCPKNP